MKKYIQVLTGMVFLVVFYFNFAFGQEKSGSVTEVLEKEALSKANDIY
jgi:hypothetical protein